MVTIGSHILFVEQCIAFCRMGAKTLWVCLLLLSTWHSAITEREIRSLMYPKGGVCKLIIGLGVPVDQPKRLLSWGINFQFQYALPTNITALKQFPTIQRGTRSTVNRAASYQALQTVMDRYGVAGRSCLLRTICEVAETPLHHNGLVGELIHVVLTPGYGSNNEEPMDSEFHEARRLGEKGWDCREAYPSCPLGHGLLDFISVVGTSSENYL